MKSDILVDTSAWIDYFNKPDSKTGKTVEHILRNGRAVLAGVVLTEILQGAKIKSEFDAILESMLALPILEASLTTWIEAGRISFTLREKGITIPTTDLIIASLALENNCSILTLDQYFQKIPGVKIY
jgi:hypothetical protein